MEKERIIIFGAGGSGKKYYEQVRDEYEVIAFADNFKSGELFGLPILKPGQINGYDYDAIIIASVAAGAIKRTLIEAGIKKSKISNSYIEMSSAARDTFCAQVAKEIYRRGLRGAVAEAGVFQGDFASLINANFADRKLYLFDTFTGFDDRDLAVEDGYGADPSRGDYFRQTSIGLVMSKMSHPEKVVIRQGYVPETFQGLEEEFCFVNLDMDLYQPTLAALEWFWPRMVRGGVVLIHDYFDETGTYPNLKKAVIKFTEENGTVSIPIGDNLSIALIK